MSLLKVSVIALAVAAPFAFAAPPWPRSQYTTIKTRADEIADEYDYVIVGGGTSGLTVGDRLSENGKYSVLAIEYGYYDSQTGMHPKRMFNITSEPSPALNDRTFFVGLGCVVGGSSSVNGQVFLRGTREEYDAWKTLGGPGSQSTWDWENLLAYFKKGITLVPPEQNQAKAFNITYDMEYWGTESSIYASFGRGVLEPTMKVMYDAMKNMPGMVVPVDSGAGETGLYWYPMSQDGEKFLRSYARTGHWDALGRDNYDLLVGAKVNKILFDGDTAVGVQWRSRNTTEEVLHTVKARREVILAAGAAHTPQILMLSGIGPAPLLEQAKIPVKVNLPGVGSNFQDHSYIPSITYTWGETPQPPQLNITQENGGGGPPALVTMIGMPVISPEGFAAIADRYAAQDPAAYLPSTYTEEQIEGYRQQQLVQTQFLKSKDVTFLEIMLRGGPGGAVQNLHCMSRGTILIDPENPEGEMKVDYRAASNPIDIDVMVENIKFMRRYMTTGDLAQYKAREIAPGTDVSTDEQLASWARNTIIPSVFHPIGTAAKMPREWGGVVDEELLVYGVKNLSVIDASILPTIVGATTSMTVYAVAEKAADIIKARTDWD